MKRRTLLQTLAALPASYAFAQTAKTPDNFKITAVAADQVAKARTRFFSADQYAALNRLGEILMPAVGERPGAKEAESAGFLDFLLSQSPRDRQALYRNGLDRLNADSRKRYNKPFAQVTVDEAKPMLEPLKAAWTYEGPSDPYARFLDAAKDDFYRATVNSRPFTVAMAATSRGAAGLSYYWLPVE